MDAVAGSVATSLAPVPFPVLALRDRWRDSTALVAEVAPLLDERVERSDDPSPSALAARGWRPFLLALDDAQLGAIETGGLLAPWPADTPADLLDLLAQARATCALPALDPEGADVLPTAGRRHEKPRKGAQVDAFARIVAPLAATATRVLDVGSGHGHLTRELAVRLRSLVVGLERDLALVERARTLARDAALFARTDVVRDGLALTAGDCVVGLHACGELGDVLVAAAAHAGAAVALVGCCLQKRRPEQRPALATGGMAFSKRVLGLSNLTPRSEGVEAAHDVNIEARQRRLALRRLLEDAGQPVAFGAEIKGLNRRTARHELRVLVERAFQVRHLAVPSARHIAEADACAEREHAALRRLQLPRTLLARALEVHVLLDRAMHLAERGFDVEVGVAFPATITPRNLVLRARRVPG